MRAANDAESLERALNKIEVPKSDESNAKEAKSEVQEKDQQDPGAEKA